MTSSQMDSHRGTKAVQAPTKVAAELSKMRAATTEDPSAKTSQTNLIGEGNIDKVFKEMAAVSQTGQ